MWFDEIMDDCKQALRTSKTYKGIFVPLFINLGLIFLMVIFLAISLIFLLPTIIRSFVWELEFYEVIVNNIPTIIIMGVITYFLVIIGTSLIKAGSIKLYQQAVNNMKPKTSDFFDGIKQSFFNIFKGTLFIHLIILLISPIVLGLFLLYTMTIGVLSGGWGVMFLASFVAVFLAPWPIIVVVDNIKPLKAIGLGFKLGKKYLPGLFILMLANIMIGNYLVTILGPMAILVPFGIVFVGWFMTGVVGTYFNVVVLLVYNRKKQILKD